MRNHMRRPLLEDYARIAKRRGLAIDATAVRMGSETVREILVYLSTSGQLAYSELRSVLAECRAVPTRQSLGYLEPMDSDWTARLARVLALQSLEKRDRADAMTIYSYLHASRHINTLGPLHPKLFGELLCAEGHDHELQRILSHLELTRRAREAINSDLKNPFRGGPYALDEEPWLSIFVDALGFARTDVRLESGEDVLVPFDRLRGTLRPSSVQGPLVSVVLTIPPSSGNTADFLRTAVQSILDQTWANLELLIVEGDASSSGRSSSATAMSGYADGRIRFVSGHPDFGVYGAKNVALEVAKGAFVTFQRPEDWSHPRRIEAQVTPFLADDGVIATTSRCVRVTPNLELSRPGAAQIDGSASSLMVRLPAARERVGYFDEVLVGADEEYRGRIETTFGASSIHDLDGFTHILLRDPQGSFPLFGRGGEQANSLAYRSAYRLWHEEANDEDLFLPRQPDARPFPAPVGVLRASSRQQHFDVVLVGDWRADGGPQRSMEEEIRALAVRGLRVGACHMEALRFMTARDSQLSERIVRLAREGLVEIVSSSDPLDVDLLLVRYPPIMQFPQQHSTAWNVARTWLVANQAPSERDGGDLRYLVDDVSTNCRQLFGVDPVWVPQGPTVRGALEMCLDSARLSVHDNPGILDASLWFREHRPWESDRPRVGRHSRDNPMKFPATADSLLRIYDHPDADLVMMGAERTVLGLLEDRDVPKNWTLLPYGAMPVAEFLGSIDFFMYFDHEASYEAFGRSILEAIASGCAVVLPYHFAPVFGDAALYASDDDAIEIVRSLHREPELFHAQVRRAQKHVRKHFSHQAFVRIVAGAIDRRLEDPTDPPSVKPD